MTGEQDILGMPFDVWAIATAEEPLCLERRRMERQQLGRIQLGGVKLGRIQLGY